MQFLEKTGDLEGAKKGYIKSGCGSVEIPRMFFQAGKFTELEAYVKSQVCMCVCTVCSVA